MIKIILPGKPLAWMAPYISRRGKFNPRSAVLNDYRIQVREQYQGPIIKEAVTCYILAYMPIPKATSKKNRELMLLGRMRPICRPDRTNIAKLVEDALIEIVLQDDSQIVGGPVEKWYCESPRMELIIQKVLNV